MSENVYLTFNDPPTIASVPRAQRLDHRERYFDERMHELESSLNQLKIDVVVKHPGILSAVVRGSVRACQHLDQILRRNGIGSLMRDAKIAFAAGEDPSESP